MKNKTKYILLLLVIILLISFIIYFFTRNQSTFIEDKENFLLSLPEPSIHQEYRGKTKVKLEIKESEYKFPSKLPLLERQSTIEITPEDVMSLSSRLGFEDKPIISEDQTKGNIYIFNSSTNSLIVTLQMGSIKYTPNKQARDIITNAINKQLTDKNIIEIAKNFLLDKIEIPNNNLTHVDTFYLTLNKTLESYQQTSKEAAVLYQLNFSPTYQKLPLITSNPLNTPYTVQIIRDGEILNSEIVFPPTYKTTNTQYKIKNYDQFLSRINEAYLVSLNDSNVNLPDLGENEVKEITITEVKLAYLLDDINSQVLQPIFILEGTTSLDFKTILYLPALSRN